MEFEPNRLFHVDSMTAYCDYLVSRNKRPSVVEAQLVSNTHDFELHCGDTFPEPFAVTTNRCDHWTLYRMTDQEASPMDNTSPHQLSNLDLSPTSTVNNDLAGNPPQPELTPSLSILGLENVSLSSPSPPASPLLGISELSNLPSTIPAINNASPVVLHSRILGSPPSLTFDSDSEPSEQIESSDPDYIDDDEYVPTPAKSKRRARARSTPKGSYSRPSNASTRPISTRNARSSRSPRYSPYLSSPSPSVSSSGSSSSGSPGHISAQLRLTSSRKKQVTRAVADTQPRNGTSKWGCPHCDYTQANRRRPDLRRHIAGHCKGDDHVCCGVSVADTTRYDVPADSEAAEWKGEIRIGGCWQVFSRRDALVRHLKNSKKKCVCDVVDNEVRKARRR